MSQSETLTFPPVIDASMRAAFVACPHAFWRQYLCGLQRSGLSVHLHFGAAFAAGIARLRRSHYYHAASVDQALAHGARAIIEAWGDFEPPAGSPKTLERCIGALEAYTAQYPPATDHIRPLIEGPTIHTEFAFALPLAIRHPETDQPLVYSGRFDMLALMQGMKVIEDDKTTSQLGDSWGTNWRLRAQFTGYAWGAAEYGHRIEGIVIRGISILKRTYGHAEVIETRPKWMISSWQRQLDRDIHRMIALWREARGLAYPGHVWDQNLDSACSSYGGCQYLDLCTSPEPDKWLANYEVRHYDPLGALE